MAAPRDVLRAVGARGPPACTTHRCASSLMEMPLQFFGGNQRPFSTVWSPVTWDVSMDMCHVRMHMCVHMCARASGVSRFNFQCFSGSMQAAPHCIPAPAGVCRGPLAQGGFVRRHRRHGLDECIAVRLHGVLGRRRQGEAVHCHCCAATNDEQQFILPGHRWGGLRLTLFSSIFAFFVAFFCAFLCLFFFRGQTSASPLPAWMKV